MTDRIWLKSYPSGVPADIDPGQYPSLVALMEEAFQKYADRVAYSFMGKDVSYAQTDSLSKAFATYLQGLGLVKGDRVAIMMPNVPQYPVAVAAILRAGFVVVNVNPLYTPRELEHQLKTRAPRRLSSSKTSPPRCSSASRTRRSSMWCCAPWVTSWACSRARWSTTWCATSRRWFPPTTCRGPCASTRPLPRAPVERSRSRTSSPTTSPCCNTPAAPRA
jgi:hypothetical protein